MNNTAVDWSGLLPDILVDISFLLPLMEDFTAFRDVCTSWRAAGAIRAKTFKALSKVPLLMLPQKEEESDEREFYSIFNNKIFIKMPVAEAKGKRCIDAGFGWILAMSSDGEISMFNPFSPCSKIELPNVRTSSQYLEHPPPSGLDIIFIRRGMLSANPMVTSNFTLFVVGNVFMGLWRNGDNNWTKLDVDVGEYGNMCYCNGKMYAISIYGEIWMWDPYGDNPTKPQVIMLWEDLLTGMKDKKPYLVKSSDGELLIILRNNFEYPEYFDTGVTHFGLMRVDLVKMECEEINGLGNDVVFLGDNTAISVAATDFPDVLKPNCIYFTDDSVVPHFSHDYDKGGGKDMGIYNVRDGSIERFAVEAFSRVCPPQWIFPSF